MGKIDGDWNQDTLIPVFESEEAEAAAALDALSGVAEDGPYHPASDAAIGYVLDLQEERVLPAGHMVKSEDEFRKMEAGDVSADINLLKTYPKKTPGEAPDPWPNIPSGRYALEHDRFGWLFYQVDKPKQGRWVGYVYVKKLTGAPGDWLQTRLNKTQSNNVLRAIEARGVEGAAADFGHQHGVCGLCGSPLSNAESIERGIGPVCARKAGW